MSRLQSAVEQLQFARAYTLRLLDTVDEADWFRMPSEGVTHVAWQVGHLAMADYRLCLERTRGKRPEDEGLIPAAFLKRFGRDSVPDPDPANNPPPEEIRAVFYSVRAAALAEVSLLTEAQLDEPPATPHPLFNTKLAGIQYCSFHEALHTGQIALLRRLLGQKPTW